MYHNIIFILVLVYIQLRIQFARPLKLESQTYQCYNSGFV